MTDLPALVYLESDDEITSVVRRVRSAQADRVVVVAPGRSRATSSAVALRLLARVGDEVGRQVVVVGDPLTRSLATEAGLSAFGSVDEARTATLAPGAVPPSEAPRHASIHVVRGAGSDETLATPAASTPAPAATARASGPATASDETVAVPVLRRERPLDEVKPRVRPRGSRGLAAVLGVAAALLVAGIVAGATLLPAATITIVAAAADVSKTYELVVREPVRRQGTVEATATVTATGSYDIVEAARGVVTFRNFNIGAVEVPAATLVAAGEQAFETTDPVTVPSGFLTPSGTIAAGEADAPVVASAAGPAANVDAGAIDTILTQSVRNRLRGFPQNNARLVINADATSGGMDQAGPEITQADVDAAVEELRAELVRRAEEERPDLGELAVLDTPPAQPVIDLPDGLVGTRDEPEADIDGSLAWTVVAVDLEALRNEAMGRLASDPALPEEHDLLDGSLSAELRDPVMDGDAVVVEATVEAVAVPRIDPETVRGRVSGLSAEEARLALADLGAVDVDLWPDWVESVPELDWRVTIRIEGTGP